MLFFYILLNTFGANAFVDTTVIESKIIDQEDNCAYEPLYQTIVRSNDEFDLIDDEDFYLAYRLRFSKKL